MNEEKKTRRRWFHLTRGQRTVRNLVLFFVLAVLVWGIYGCPLPVKAAFRRLEREYMLEPGEITLLLKPKRKDGLSQITIAGKTYSCLNVLCASATPEWVFSASSDDRSFGQEELVFCCARGDGVDVVPLAYHQLYYLPIVNGKLEMYHYLAYLALDLTLPEEAVRVEMDMEYRMFDLDGNKVVTISGAGIEQDSGAWLFLLNEPSGSADMNGQIGALWTIRAYDAGGELLQELEGTVREYAVREYTVS